MGENTFCELVMDELDNLDEFFDGSLDEFFDEFIVKFLDGFLDLFLDELVDIWLDEFMNELSIPLCKSDKLDNCLEGWDNVLYLV